MKSPGTTMVDWSLLPKDLLQLISKSIESHFDFLRFRRVCTTWRSSAPLNLRPPPIICSRVQFHTDKPEFKYSIWKRTILLFKFTADQETPKSWLVRLDEDEFGKKRFSNPLYWGKPVMVEYPVVFDTSKVHVQELGHQYVKLKVVNFGEDGPSTAWTIVYMDMCLCFDDRFIFIGKDNNVITFEQNHAGILIFRKVGGEELSRIEVEGFIDKCVDFVQFEHKCYVTDRVGNTFRVDPFSATSFLMAEEYAVDPFVGFRTGRGFSTALAAAAEEESTVGGMFMLGRRFKYLVELCGNLLLVEVERGSENATSALRCEVFQLDEERKRWDHVVSMGNAILFVGQYCKFSIPAIPGAEGNCVVFIFREGFLQDKTSELEKTFVFHLSSGRIVPLDDCPDLFQLFHPPSFL